MSVLPRGESRTMLDPKPGYWLIRLRKGAAEVPASIQFEQTVAEPGAPGNLMERSPILTARINGEIVPWERVWHTRGRPIDKAEHDYRVAMTDWAVANEPAHPAADATRAIDTLTVPLPF